ncbi:MAG: AAA family ATPase [Desulfovibrionaceae bacterium]|nr:AAA family ATPase [Desulfovibrionaceae bacterium]
MSTKENVDLNLLPLANSNFFDLRSKNQIYVDKTELIYQIVNDCAPLLYLRPSGFGKSLLSSTLHCLFEKGLEFFKGLKIEKLWKDETYLVAHLDFLSLADKNATEFKEGLAKQLIQELKIEGDLSKFFPFGFIDPANVLDNICRKEEYRDTVLIIDNFDTPLTHHLNDPENLKNIMRILSSFYAVIKQHTGYFRFIFITGVVRALEVSIFSCFNNYIDLSFSQKTANIVGFTQDDLNRYFDPYVDNAAQILKLPKDEVYQKLEQYYGGYQFSDENSEVLYNPWSILSFLKNPSQGFVPYGLSPSGSPSFVQDHLKISDKFDFLDYYQRFIYDVDSQLSRRYGITETPSQILFYHSGYLTISTKLEKYGELVVPNREVEDTLLKLYLEKNNLTPSSELKSKMEDLLEAIDSKNLQTIVDTFNHILQECVQNPHTIFKFEQAVRDTLYAVFLEIPNLQIFKEREYSRKNCYLALITPKTCLVIDFRKISKEMGVEDSLKLAKEEVKNNPYTSLFSKTHKIYLLAMVISEEEKKILPDFSMEVL